ncbi:MAG: hypothetical protein WA510_21800 [Acidobacteriaceae bacterium]
MRRCFNSPGKSRFVFLLPLGLLMLSMAVFAWGLQYKLSLYKTHQSITHVAPEAKLLSQKERPVTGQAVDAAPTPLPLPAALPAALLLLAMTATTPGLFQTAGRYLPARSRERAAAPLPLRYRAVFFRPPPVR